MDTGNKAGEFGNAPGEGPFDPRPKGKPKTLRGKPVTTGMNRHDAPERKDREGGRAAKRRMEQKAMAEARTKFDEDEVQEMVKEVLDDGSPARAVAVRHRTSVSVVRRVVASAEAAKFGQTMDGVHKEGA